LALAMSLVAPHVRIAADQAYCKSEQERESCFY
jgi:hypothetical protein